MVSSWKNTIFDAICKVTTVTSINAPFDSLMKEEGYIDYADEQLTIDDLPDWYDEDLFKKGQQFQRRNVLGVSLGSFLGLITVLAIPSTLDILIVTKQSGTSCKAFKRYAQTLLHIKALYDNDINDPKGRWWKSLNTIRWKHWVGNKVAAAAGAGRIQQRDMGLTQFGFIGYIMTVPEKLGISCEPAEFEGFSHLWRVIGYLLGISDTANICQDHVAGTIQICQKISEEVIVDLIRNQSMISKEMVLIMIDGFTCIDVALDADSILHFWYELNGMKYDKPLGIYSRLNILHRNTILYLTGLPFVGSLVRSGFNYYLNFSYWLLEQLPIIAYMRFGKKQANINLYQHDHLLTKKKK